MSTIQIFCTFHWMDLSECLMRIIVLTHPTSHLALVWHSGTFAFSLISYLKYCSPHQNHLCYFLAQISCFYCFSVSSFVPPLGRWGYSFHSPRLSGRSLEAASWSLSSWGCSCSQSRCTSWSRQQRTCGHRPDTSHWGWHHGSCRTTILPREK